MPSIYSRFAASFGQVLAIAALLPAQHTGAVDALDPLQLVSRAEARCRAGDTEDGILLLWRAIASLEPLASHPVRESALAAAHKLLAAHDPLDDARRETHALVARLQVGLAKAYRGRKWYETAAERLAVAARFDRSATTAESAALARVRPASPERAPAARAGAADGAAAAEAGNALFERAAATRSVGTWRLVAPDCLECGLAAGDGVLSEWITAAESADREVRVEIESEAGKRFNAGIWVGYGEPGCGHLVQLFANGEGGDTIVVIEAENWVYRELAQVRHAAPADSGKRGITLQVRGKDLRVLVDGVEPFTVAATAPIRGAVGLGMGASGHQEAAVRFRGLRVGPLPADAPSDAELRQTREHALRDGIVGAIDEAARELEAGQGEAAAIRLRSARQRLFEMPAGLLRDQLVQTIDDAIGRADRLLGRRREVAERCATELVGLADRYLEREMPRAAFEVVKVAAGFAPAGLAAREQQARRDIDSWNAAQVAARAAELQPPADDGAVLREWFATGTPLYAGATTAWRVEGARARVEQLVGGDFAAILPKPGLPPLKSAAIHVHLPAVGCSAGFCLDVVSNSDFAIARLERLPHGLALSAYRWRGEKWTRLAYEDIAMPAWKREGWFDVRLEAGASGIEVHAAGQKITIDQSRLGIAKDRYGLFAGADGKQAVTVEACAFRFSR